MKKLALLLFLLLGSKSAFSECSMSGMMFYPEQKEISLNPLFIIEGYAISQKTINSFEHRSVYLESENGDLIKLNLLEILRGQMQITQAIFKPSRQLDPNTTYFLKYEDETENEAREMKRYNSEKEKNEKVFWRTSGQISSKPLNNNLKLEFEKTQVNYYGCGPDANAVFKIENMPKTEVWYKTEVVDLSTNQKNTYYIKAWKGQLRVGHGMCSGAFRFNRKGAYKVRFTPKNSDGISLATTRWQTFDSPFKNEKNPF